MSTKISPETISSERGARMLVDVYVSHVTKNLYEEMLARMKPLLLEAAAKAALDLKVDIKAMLDNYGEQMAFQLTVKGLDDANDHSGK